MDKIIILLIKVIGGGLLIFPHPQIVASANSVNNAPLSVKAAVPRYFPPTYFVDSTGKPQGLAIDMMEKIAQRANLTITYKVKNTLTETKTALDKGEVDLIPNLGITPERLEKYSFTTPIDKIPVSVFVLRDNQQINTLADLSGHSAGVVKENVAIEVLRKKPKIKLEVFESPEHALFHLLAREVDAIAYPQNPINYLAQSISADYRLKIIKPPLIEVERAIAVRRDNTVLRQRLDKAVKEFLATAEYQKIHHKWYDKSLPFWTVSLVLWLGGGLLLLTVIGMSLWRYYSLRPLYHLKQTQAALKSSEARYRAIIEDQTELICRFRLDGTLTFVNEAYCRYFQKNSEELINQPFLPLIPQEDQEIVSKNISFLSLENPVITHEHRVILPDGKIHWQQWINRAIFSDNAEIIEVQGVGRDISDRKQIERELQQTLDYKEAINHISEQIRKTLEIPEILQITTEELRQIIKCDRVVIYQFNTDWSGEFLAESVAPGWVPLMGNKSKKIWKDTYLQENQGGHYRQGQTFAVNDIYTVGHQQCHIDLLEQFQAKAYMIVPIFIQDKLWGLLASYQNSGTRNWCEDKIKLFQEISLQLGLALQQAELLNQLKEAKNSAEAANEAKSQFLAHMSHELRTPLNAILGFTQLLSHENSLSEEQQEYLRIINSSGEYLLSLIRDILDMAKIEAGKMTIENYPFNLPNLIENLAKMFRFQCEEKGLSLQIEIAPDIPQKIITDEGKLQQILINLLSNAIKFTQIGQVTLRVRGKSLENHLIFEVQDTGPGIDPQEAPNLFNPFFQTKLGQQTQEGTGLGLAISRHFVEIMGGYLSISCPIKGGTLFQVILPVTVVTNQEIVSCLTKERVIGLAHDQPIYRILIVDDRPNHRDVLVNLLKPLGFEVKEANNGQEAVNLWETWQPHLIWMDLRMPIMDGYEATRQIKAKIKESGLSVEPSKIIALSASVFADERANILKVGCDDFVSKPFSESVILDKIAQHLGVAYVCEPSSMIPQITKTPNSIDHQKLQEELTKTSLEWRNKLYQKAASADSESIFELLKQLPPNQKFLSETLTKLVNNFSFDIIMDLANLNFDS